MKRGNEHDVINKERDVEELQTEPEAKYPYSVFFIISNEFCERFCFYGMRSILSLYLVNILLYSKEATIIIYHTFTMMVYFFPLIGAIISDSFLGKFRTIFYVSMIYAAGSILLSLSSISSLNLPMREFSLVGLLLIAIGTGGIKPCVSAFGGDQFVLPQQAALLATFFSLFYFSINAGSLLSTFLTPILREDVHCFGNSSCYPLAFGVPGILMVVSIVIFGLGKPLYKIKQPEGNIVLKVTKCIVHAVKTKVKSKESKDHWLDHSTKKYGQIFVDDIKATLKVLVLYTPLPIFWALYDQQGTAWTFQAVRMNGDVGFYTILPDQFQLINPLLIMIFIPLFQYCIYPAFQKIGLLRGPLEKMTWGGFLAALAFIVSASISLKIEATDPVLPGDGFTQIRFYNPLACPIKIVDTQPCSLKEDLNGLIESMGYAEITDLKMKDMKQRSISFDFEADCLVKKQQKGVFSVYNKNFTLVYFTHDGLVYKNDTIEKDTDSGSPFLRTLMNISPDEPVYNIALHNNAEGLVTVNNNQTDRLKLSYGKYEIMSVNDMKPENLNKTRFDSSNEASTSLEIDLQLGGVYTLIVRINNNKIEDYKLITVTNPNTISMLWLLPQYIIITAAEILFSVTGLEFSYSQAPVSMKSVLTAAFLLTTSIGNLLIALIEAVRFFDKASYDFFLYTGLMIVDMIIFSFLASKYKYVNFEESDEQMKLDKDNNVLNVKTDNGVENPVFVTG